MSAARHSASMAGASAENETQAGRPRPAFDTTAREYDRGFSHTTLGRWLRARVWNHLEACFGAGDRVLELGCGTGEDAVFLAERGLDLTVLDSSTVMVEITEEKARRSGVRNRVTAVAADLNDPEIWHSNLLETHEPSAGGLFDGAFSNFGVLNCVENRRELARSLAARLRPGGRVVMVVMGPICPVESAAFLLRGRVSDATRRFRSGREARVGSGSVRVHFPSVGKLAQEFAEGFVLKDAYGIGTVLPTTEMTAFADRHPRLFRALTRVEPLASRLAGRYFADHYLVEFERRSP